MSIDSADRSAMPENAADAATVETAVEPTVETTVETTEPAEPTITFADLGLPEAIVRKLNQNGVVTPFPIQAATIPDALSGRDILGRGRTGSGKTLSFGLPLLTQLSGGHTDKRRPRGVILTPTRELAMQVADALQPYGDVLGLKMKVVCGGTSMQNQIYALERGVDVLVATPGRLRDLINRGAAILDQVQIAVLDEADQMSDMGFLPEVTEILDLVPAGGQRLLFSATLENEIDSLVKRYLVSPVTHEVDAAQGAVTTMTHHVLVVKPKDKAPVTAAIAARKGRTIIFVRTQMGADRVAEQLIESGVRADALHGGMTQGARTRTLEDFKAGQVNVLVATDVAARGIHVDGIDLVLNVDPAGDHKDYLHRSGRTARAGKSGTVVSLALPHQRKQIFRLMEDAGVDASRHIIGGAGVFDEDVAKITGARSLTDVQADAVQNAAAQAEREVADLTRQLERVQRRATELREEADRLTARSARERGEDPDEAIAAKAAEMAELAAEAAAAAASVPAPREERQQSSSSYQRRDDRGNFDRRDNRDSRDSRDSRPSYDRRDSRPSYGDRDRDDRRSSYGSRNDSRPSYGNRSDSRPSYGNRSDSRPSYGNRDRDDRRPSSYDRSDSRPSYGNRSDSRPSYGNRSDSRPSYGNRDRDDRRPSSYDRSDSRPSYGNRSDSRPSYGNRDDRDSRPSYTRDSNGPSSSSSSYNDRKPRWKRNG
ncbi:DEAD/DEAH box helicase [Streptomyces cocklensis]|uniref:Superfamily II DNA and RNA helicase n=1 Tax=Actinacidiphila cocklensis TaxID=887465 RepID=A0A9W4DW03_9ACTN|nr:DEAD/DEAH box helicase [Actinacidiphila cocklensis]MDD1064012.1 DEAD/DEAH box helicase [Actinacidiphila cocklensis]CAG6396951.1 Superfamily II DNA and RNA helicase [Actinacidiphila cocklensis]